MGRLKNPFWVACVLAFVLIPGILVATDRPLREKVGQMVMVGFHGKHVSDADVQTLAAQIRAGDVGGVILFSYNLGTDDEIKTLVSFLKAQSSQYPLLVAVDQEGGRVARLRKRLFPSAKSMGRKSVVEAEALYADMGTLVASYGINLVLGPVVDVDHDPPSPVIGGFSRSYSRDPETVVRYSRAFISGMRAAHVLTAIKHFPGHGSAQGDTHEGMVDTTAVWSDKELIPYRQLSTANMVMVSHIVNKKLDETGAPASLSGPMITGILREILGYQGVVITDDLQMGAIQSHYLLPEVVSRAVLAGNDILLFGNNAALLKASQSSDSLSVSVLDLIIAAVGNGTIPVSRIDASYGRILRLKEKLTAF